MKINKYQSIATILVQSGKSQAKNILNVLSGNPLIYPSLTSQSLDLDDVEIAKYWLANRQLWQDEEEIQRYEDEFAIWNGSKYAYSFLGGRVALSACIYALELKPGDEVIIPGYTCVVVPNAFAYAGVEVVFSDIELDTYGLDINHIESKITKKTKAILLQHLYGLVSRDSEEIIKLARQYKLRVIEDCAHATGAKYRGIKVGNFGDCAFYSSEQSKVFTTIQGGVAVTNDQVVAERIKQYSQSAPVPDQTFIRKLLNNVLINYNLYKHPARWIYGDLYYVSKYNNYLISTTPQEEEGIQPSYYGCKMPAPVAALGRNQLKKIDRYNQKRRETALRWKMWCEEKGYRPPIIIPDSEPVLLRYPVMVEPERKRNTRWALSDPGVQVGKWFVSHVHPARRYVENCPNADRAIQQCINFPGVVET